MRTVIIEPGDERGRVVDLASDVAEFQKIVGGYIEAVGFPVAQTIAYINEEGKLDGLPINAQATAVLQANRRIFPEDYIAGPMIVCGAVNGEECSLDPEQTAAVLAYLETGR